MSPLRIEAHLAGWKSRPDSYAVAYVRPWLNALCASNLVWLQTNPGAPPLYKAGVVYRREPPGQERWKDIPTILSDGFGDCEDLACWRVAELRLRGIAARPVIRATRKPGPRLFHIIVGIGANREDPSRLLGM